MTERDSNDSLPVRPRGQFELVDAPAEWAAAPAWSVDEDEGIDVRRLLDLFWRKKWWILLAAALGVGAGYYLLHSVAPVYESRGTVWVQSRDRQDGPIRGPEVLEGQGWTDLFSSRAVLEPVVRQERLFLSIPDESRDHGDLFAGFDLSENVVDGTYGFSIDSAGQYVLRDASGAVIERGTPGDSVGAKLGFKWQPDPTRLARGQEVHFRVASPARSVQVIRSNLKVLFNPNAGNLITTRFTWPSRDESAEILNTVLDSFLGVARDLQTEKLREKVAILKQQTEYAANRLDSAELALERTRVANITLPGEPQSYPTGGGGQAITGGQTTQDPVFQHYFQQKVSASELSSEISELRGVLTKLRAGEDVDVTGLHMIPAVDSSAALTRTLGTLVDKTAERQSLLLRYTEQHPAVQDVTQEIADLRSRALPSQIGGLIDQLQARLSTVQGEIDAQAAELRKIPPRTIEEARLRRDMQMAEQLHNDLLVRLKEAELAASTSMPDLQVVDRATPPGSPMSNQGPRYFLMASMAGVGLGLGGVLLFDLFDRRFRYPDQVPKELGLPILGVIPRIRGGGRPEPAAESVIEAFRVVRSQLKRLRSDLPTVIVVTSPTPRDGKTLIAANLAISFAGSRRRTLLVDGDVRRGDAERLFGLPASPGLTDSLANGSRLPDLLRSTDVPGLFFLSHGRLRGFDPVLLEGDPMDRLMEELRGRFDVIVIDAPPLVAGTDPLLLGERADQVVMVLRTGETDMEVARARLESLGGFDIPLTGVVLNDVPDRALYQKYYSSYKYYVEGEVAS